MTEFTRTIYNKLSHYPIIFCLKNNISANTITIFDHFITLTLGCYFFSRGTHLGFILGIGVMVINVLLDYLDGDVARRSQKKNKLGDWLDCGFDVIIQGAVLGAIAVGCHKNGLSIIWIVMFFISSIANNFVSFNYNTKFGFHSYKGNSLFREFMSEKNTLINRMFKGIIDPSSNHVSLIIFTFRYWILLGCLLNVMPVCFKALTVISTVKWIIMYVLYSMHLQESRKLYVLQGLAMLDEERSEFYRFRNN